VTATKKTEAKFDLPEKFTESADAYVQRLLKGHERMACAFEATRARNARLADKVFSALIAGQRDALELGKVLVQQPTAYAKNMEAMMHTLSVAQERALDVAKTVYREESDAVGELRTATEQAFESSKGWMPAMEKMSGLWSPATK